MIKKRSEWQEQKDINIKNGKSHNDNKDKGKSEKDEWSGNKDKERDKSWGS